MFSDIPDSFAEKVLYSMGEPALIFDEDMTVCWVNPAAEMFFSHSSEYLRGKKCTQLFHGFVECMAKCPVEKAFESGEDQVLAVSGINAPGKLVEALPCGSGSNRFILAIIHSMPEKSRTRALKRDFAAALNRSATLEEAADTILNAMGSLAFVNWRGIYLPSVEGFKLLKGVGVPEILPSAALEHSTPGEITYIPSGGRSLEHGAAVLPVGAGVLLVAGRGSWGPESRVMLELIGEVLSDCVERLASGAFSTP